MNCQSQLNTASKYISMWLIVSLRCADSNGFLILFLFRIPIHYLKQCNDLRWLICPSHVYVLVCLYVCLYQYPYPYPWLSASLVRLLHLITCWIPSGITHAGESCAIVICAHVYVHPPLLERNGDVMWSVLLSHRSVNDRRVQLFFYFCSIIRIIRYFRPVLTAFLNNFVRWWTSLQLRAK